MTDDPQPPADEDDSRLMTLFSSLRQQVVEVGRNFGDQVRERVDRSERSGGLGFGGLLGDLLVGLSNLVMDVGGNTEPRSQRITTVSEDEDEDEDER